MRVTWKNIGSIHDEFMKEHYSKKKYGKYVNGCGVSSVDICDKEAGRKEKDRPCIVVNLRSPLPKKLAFPKEYKGARVFTKVVGPIRAGG